MFTTGAQTLQLNQCYLEVHRIKYAPEVHSEPMQRRGSLVNKTFIYQHQIYNIGSSLTTADTKFQTILFFIAHHYPGSFRSNVLNVAFLSPALNLCSRWIRHWAFESQQCPDFN